MGSHLAIECFTMPYVNVAIVIGILHFVTNFYKNRVHLIFMVLWYPWYRYVFWSADYKNNIFSQHQYFLRYSRVNGQYHIKMKKSYSAHAKTWKNITHFQKYIHSACIRLQFRPYFIWYKVSEIAKNGLLL